GVKVRGREHGLWEPVHRQGPVALVDENVVVDAEVGVVEVLVLAADLHRTTVRQKGQRLAEPLRAPDRLGKGSATLVEPRARLIRRGSASDPGFPERNTHPLGIARAELAGERVSKLTRSDDGESLISACLKA